MRQGESRVFQVNFWEGFGGSEVYTRFLSVALQSLGLHSTVFVNSRGRHWKELDFGDATVLPLADPCEIFPHLPRRGALILANSPLGGPVGAMLKREHRVVTFAHQPLYLKNLEPYAGSELLVGNSRHVLKSVRWAGLPCYPEPLYGVADVARLRHPSTGVIGRNSCYAWDRRKLRDRVLSWIEPACARWARPLHFARRPGLTLGIVSRLVTIKQFPALFDIVAGAIARHSNVWIEVFGSGGYAAVRDLMCSLGPIRDRVRLWGQQRDVMPVYAGLDFVLSGLPEREGMGRNLIEAQLCGTPVLAVNAPPFVETVLDGVTGHLYTDPRQDGGRDFERLLARITRDGIRPDPFAAPAHLERFTQRSFNECVRRLLRYLEHASPDAADATRQRSRRDTPDRQAA